ncbi:MAG: methyltransferase domain-containing protein, partial [Candidatus Hydrogenedentota bacterium]
LCATRNDDARSSPDRMQTFSSRKMTWKQIKDFIFLPLRIVLKEKELDKLGLTSLPEARYSAVFPHIKGRLLDIGCGENVLVKKYGDGVGIDVYPWPDVDVVCDSTRMPFADKSFDTITILASLNHIPQNKRVPVLQDAWRLLKDDGQLLITMIGPLVGYFCHKLVWRWDRDVQEREFVSGENWGLKNIEVERLLSLSGFTVEKHLTFVYGLNNIFVGKKLLTDTRNQ